MAPRYDGPPSAANVLALYREDNCRVTGELEVPVLHLEWRCHRARAVRAAGISKPADLLTLDFTAFWRKRLLLVDLDAGKLGRALRNAYGCVWRRLDPRLGEAFLNYHGTIQQTLDHTRHVGVRRLLTVIDNTPFLPTARGPDIYSTWGQTHHFAQSPATSGTYPHLAPSNPCSRSPQCQPTSPHTKRHTKPTHNFTPNPHHKHKHKDANLMPKQPLRQANKNTHSIGTI
jgi:hypothetical protein